MNKGSQNSSLSIARLATKQFKDKCINLVSQGYFKIKRTSNFSITWNEWNFTKALYEEIDELVPSDNFPFMDVEWESHNISQTTQEIGRIDLKVKQLSREEKIYLFIECKKLDKYNNTQYNYRRKGIIRYITGKYADKSDAGMMVGYVIEGKLANIISMLKKKIDKDQKLNIKRKMTYLKDKNGANGKIKIYESEHDRNKRLGVILITHMFLDFT